MIKICPKCGAINPQTKLRIGLCSDSVSCRNIIGYRNFVLFKIPIYCEKIVEFSIDGDTDYSWIYKETEKNKDKMDIRKFNAKDIDNNIINLYHYKSYNIINNQIIFHLHTGSSTILTYLDKEKARKIYKKILKIERLYNYSYYVDDNDYDY